MPILLMVFLTSYAQAQSQPTTDLPLLPQSLGPMERLLWSENGLMRKAFDFPLTAQGREEEMAMRRNMLTWHQVGGYSTFAGLVATSVIGQMILNAENPSRTLRDAKGMAVSTTIALYFTTAALSLFTPPPLIRREGWSTTSTHKLLGAMHFTGMMITPLLAPSIDSPRRQAHFHQASGYATTVVFGASLAVMFF